ncbi:MAG: phosphoribosylglycinamide formyltransferase [bacterium]|jgi:phosphoribosylglycinamide formyltransferase 1|nr:phosphoribosylglycinamide formyltransferase [bacterium]
MADRECVSPLVLGIMASHAGTNFQSILDRCLTGELPARIGVVISNNSQSGAISRARSVGIPTYHISSATHPDDGSRDRAVTGLLREHGVQLVVLAGYMKKLGKCLLTVFENKVINIHPSLLPAFGGKGMFGLKVHQAVLESGCSITGVSVHVVDGEYDHGHVIAQQMVPVLEGDTAEILSHRVLETEHRLYPSVIRLLAQGRIRIDGGCANQIL